MTMVISNPGNNTVDGQILTSVAGTNQPAVSPTSPDPDSPRVLEVVSKSESVSWKLEYENPELSSSLHSLTSCSPGLMRRRASPGAGTPQQQRRGQVQIMISESTG